MQLKEFIHDDDAVSPVIGVILMVAITVILAAVIATFVLGLGDAVSDQGPQASFSTDWDGSSGTEDTLNVTHTGGDTITAKNLYLRGDEGSAGTANNADLGKSWDNYDTIGANSKVSAGDEAKAKNIGADGDVDVVWESTSGDNSATLATWQGPDA